MLTTETPPHSKRPWVLLEAATGVAVLVALLLVALVHLYLVSLPPHHALVQANLTPSLSPTSTSVPTLAPTNLLAWQTVTFPAGFSTPTVFTDVAVAPSDADIAYACSPASLPPAIWVTYDRGRSWQLVGHLPTSQPGECYLVVDSTEPNVLVAADEYRPVGDTSPMDVYSLDFASADGGLTWQNIGSNIGYGELATYQGTTYAVDVDLRASKRTTRLVASTNLLSWRDVDASIAKSGDTVESFWLNPTNGELLAEGGNPTTTDLWDSRDGGQHWSQLPTPTLTLGGIYGQWVVQQPVAGQPWHLCETQQINSDPPHMYNLLVCSSDGGQHWIQRPALNITLHQTIFRKSDGQLLSYTPISTLYLIGLESDGSLLAYVDDASTATATMPPGIYRLSSGSSQWQRIGRAPASVRAYLATFMPFASGAIWVGGECSSLVPSQHCYSVDASGGAYTTMYP